MATKKKVAKKVVKKKNNRAFMSLAMKNKVVETLNSKADLKKGEEAGSFAYRVVKMEKGQKPVGSAMNIDGMNVKDPREIIVLKLLS